MRNAILVVLLTLAAPSVVLAAEPSPEMIQQAQGHFEKGAEWYTTGDYSKAIVEFLKGYNVVPNAMFLYNISLSYTKLGNFDEARTYAERARDEPGMAPEVAIRNEARILSFDVRDKAVDVAEAKPVLAERRQLEDPEDPPEKSSSFGALGITGVAVGVAGLGLIGGAAVVNAGVSDDLDALKAEANGGDRDRFSSLKSDVESGQSLGQILLFSGVGLAVAGVTLIAVDLMDDESSGQSTLRLVPTPTGAQAVFDLRF
ncbi:MAG: tetratricopeptide repeat protein [bacterium]